ncbi:MAG: HU family DNA-binding protein [Clostridia bacterium]
MNKADFIKAVAAKADISLKDASAAVDAFAAVVADALKSGDKVGLAGFGSFELKAKAERTGFNPIKKEAIVIPASNAPSLKFAKAFKDLFN